MHYLFGFSGRIDRAQMWFFLAITLVWLVVGGILFVLGLNWHECIEDCQSEAFKQGNTGPRIGWLLLLLVLSAVYLVSFVAVSTKRLHDRNKSGWWMVPYLAIPSAVGMFGREWSAAVTVAAIVSVLCMVELFFLPGTDGANDYDFDLR